LTLPLPPPRLAVMTRHLRVEYQGALYHFTARGTDQQMIVHAEIDRTDCLTRLGQKILPGEVNGEEIYGGIPLFCCARWLLALSSTRGIGKKERLQPLLFL